MQKRYWLWVRMGGRGQQKQNKTNHLKARKSKSRAYHRRTTISVKSFCSASFNRVSREIYIKISLPPSYFFYSKEFDTIF